MTLKANSIGVLLVLSFIFLSASSVLSGCASAPQLPAGPTRPWQVKALNLKGYTEKTVIAFGSNFTIRVWPSSKPTVPVGKALDLAIAEINRISNMADAAIAGSEVDKINTKAYAEAVPISAEFAAILIDADRMYQLSELRFDITYTPYKSKAEFTDSDFNRITDWDTKQPLTAASRRLFGDKNMILDTGATNTVRMYNQRIRLNLKGMIRGYAAEKAIRVLMKQGLGGMAVMADAFVAAIGTPFKDPSVMCIENPKNLGTCLYRVLPINPGKVLYLATSATQERPGKMFDPKEVWTLRSGGVEVAGETGAWTQFAATISAVMDDLTLNALFNRLKSPKVSGMYFIKGESGVGTSGKLDGHLDPFASVVKVGK